jgi:atypical dual specificity phosphatase
LSAVDVAAPSPVTVEEQKNDLEEKKSNMDLPREVTPIAASGCTIAGSRFPSAEWLPLLAEAGCRCIVTLTERKLEHALPPEIRNIHIPVASDDAPPLEEIQRFVEIVDEVSNVVTRENGDGESEYGWTLVHCNAGIGRTGTMLAVYLVWSQSLSASDAIWAVRKERPGAVESERQVLAIEAFERSLKEKEKNEEEQGGDGR